jgi:DNA-directed RNA polymerase subunit RPC12/RpoP
MRDEKSKKERWDRLNEGMDVTLEDLLGMNDPDVFIDYVCIACGCIDPVPEFIVDECVWGDEDGEEPTFFCPECNGTMVRKEKPRVE